MATDLSVLAIEAQQCLHIVESLQSRAAKSQLSPIGKRLVDGYAEAVRLLMGQVGAAFTNEHRKQVEHEKRRALEAEFNRNAAPILRGSLGPALPVCAQDRRDVEPFEQKGRGDALGSDVLREVSK